MKKNLLPWTKEEIIQLQTMWQKGEARKIIGRLLGRSENAVIKAIKRLQAGLLKGRELRKRKTPLSSPQAAKLPRAPIAEALTGCLLGVEELVLFPRSLKKFPSETVSWGQVVAWLGVQGIRIIRAEQEQSNLVLLLRKFSKEDLWEVRWGGRFGVKLHSSIRTKSQVLVLANKLRLRAALPIFHVRGITE